MQRIPIRCIDERGTMDRELWTDAAERCQAITDELLKGMEEDANDEPRWPDGGPDWEAVQALACVAWEHIDCALTARSGTPPTVRARQLRNQIGHVIMMATLRAHDITGSEFETETVYAGKYVARSIARALRG